jgi:hypothetical protein
MQSFEYENLYGDVGAPSTRRPQRTSRGGGTLLNAYDPFHGKDSSIRNETKRVIRNQQIFDYHIYPNSVKHDMNKNAGEMFNGFNDPMKQNRHRQAIFQSDKLQPSHYERGGASQDAGYNEEGPRGYSGSGSGGVYGGDFSTLHQDVDRFISSDSRMTPGNAMYDYQTNLSVGGHPKMSHGNDIHNSIDTMRQRKSERSTDEFNSNNQKVWEHVFTPNYM